MDKQEKERNTKLVRIGNRLFKCEFENPTGSVKDRGIAFQVRQLVKRNIRRTVIPSSGNAAISAAYYCRLAKTELTVFISPKINKKKLTLLRKLNCRIIQTLKPVSDSIRYASKNDAYNLRQSTDPNAVIGYQTIADELIIQEPRIDAIFIPVSSGATLVGVASGYQKIGEPPAIHAVQTETVHPIASLFDKSFTARKKSLADAIVAKVTAREEEVVEIIKKSRGWGWVIADEEMKKARKWLLDCGLNCSYEGAVSLAALWKAKRSGFNYKYPVCVLTGRYY